MNVCQPKHQQFKYFDFFVHFEALLQKKIHKKVCEGADCFVVAIKRSKNGKFRGYLVLFLFQKSSNVFTNTYATNLIFRS